LSVLIISNKESIITLEDPLLEKYSSEIIVDDSLGVASARNRLAEKASHELLIFLDDDVKLKESVWSQIINVKSNEVFMAQGYRHPITRIMAIKKETFNEIGKFDENIRYNGEDLDFYWRALKQGYIISIIPDCLIEHRIHYKSNWAKSHFESAYTRVKHGRISIDFFVQTNPIIALLRFAGFIYHQIRIRLK